MKTNEIRKRFVQFFEKNGHVKHESSPLIPQNDPTLLFANAGMNQFKDFFTGKAHPKNKRAVTIQKCVRAGGKHNDLENVGFTARHHTFFEMLGNFSFGDYFKNEAIKFAWQFLTVDLNLPKDKLYITVHETDEEARKIWHEQEGVPLERIFYRGDADNFWEMGEVGPCGPCSEIFFDHGQEFSDGADTSECILDDEGRYVEIWNLVFMQYEKFKNQKGEIEKKDLPNPCVDTGAGLERVAATMQSVYWNYDIDAFRGIIDQLEEISQKKYSDTKYSNSFRVIADHIRAATMLITDGVIPSNEGRGYVLRRIIRRAVRHLEELGIEKITLSHLVDTVFLDLGEEYPQNKSNHELAKKYLKLEEEKFRTTLKTGLELLKKEIKQLKGKSKEFPAGIAFKLYDTYGFPFDLTELIIQEQGLTVDEKKFKQFMEKQKESSRSASNFTVQEDDKEKFYQLLESHGETKFLGYDKIECEAKLLGSIQLGDHFAHIFNQTPFYGESGGQVGDTGSIYQGDNLVGKITDTQKPVDGLIAHFSRENLKEGTSYRIVVNDDRRELIKRNHSATHLLQAALIEVLGSHVKQAGSRVSEDSLRFDFTQPDAVSKSDLKKIEDLVNRKISQALPVEASLMSKDEATKKGAMALFGEKYGDTVRVLEMGKFSLELCGGTHVKNTNEIGLFTILSESSLSSGIRRIEATSSINAHKHLQERSSKLAEIEQLLSANLTQVTEKLELLQQNIKEKTKLIQKLEDQIRTASAKNIFNDIKKLKNGKGVVVVDLDDTPAKELRNISDKFIDQNKTDTLFLYTQEEDKTSYLLRTHKNNKDINCSNILKSSQDIVNGRGGGRPDMAQGSGQKAEFNKFISEIISQIEAL